MKIFHSGSSSTLFHFLEVDAFAQFLAGLEVRNVLLRHLDTLARLGVPAGARRPVVEAEAANPRISIRSPSARLSAIASRIIFTASSASFATNCGNCAAKRSISSDLVIT
jgi:hypothetical protein